MRVCQQGLLELQLTALPNPARLGEIMHGSFYFLKAELLLPETDVTDLNTKYSCFVRNSMQFDSTHMLREECFLYIFFLPQQFSVSNLVSVAFWLLWQFVL